MARYPVDDWFTTQNFGEDPDYYAQYGLKGHNGLDGRAAIGTPVKAPEDATVFRSANGVKDQYIDYTVAGETVVLKGANYEHWLLHNSRRVVAMREFVRAGQIVAYSGNTGASKAPHCHWGVRPLQPDTGNGYRGFVDPMLILGQGEPQMTNAEIDQIISLAFNQVVGKAPSDQEFNDYRPLIKNNNGQGIIQMFKNFDTQDIVKWRLDSDTIKLNKVKELVNE